MNPTYSSSQRRLKPDLPEQSRRLLSMVTTPRTTSYLPINPTDKQSAFLCLSVKEALYGGAAGGGKSYALLAGALQYVDVPGYSALILRQTFGQLTGEGGLIDIAQEWLGGTDAKWNGQKARWTFPSGATVNFGYLQRDDDRYQYQGLSFQYVAFDELTHWRTDKPYRYLFSRLRQPQYVCEDCGQPIERCVIERWAEEMEPPGWMHNESEADPNLPTCDEAQPPELNTAPDGTSVVDVPLRMRTGTNPGGKGAGWVYARFIEPWEKWRDGKAPKPDRVFIPARLDDNKYLNRASYVETLSELDPVELARLLKGDWKIKPTGTMFQRAHFEARIIEKGEVPDGAKWVRYWDIAATEVTVENADPDWTAGVLAAMHEGRLYIVDVVRVRLHPEGVENEVKEAAARDGRRVPIRMEQEPGASGKSTISHYGRHVVNGYNFDGIPTVKDKVSRASLWAPKVRRGECFLVRGDWNEAFIEEAVDFSEDAAHDDQVDGVSGSFEHLTGLRRGKASVIV